MSGTDFRIMHFTSLGNDSSVVVGGYQGVSDSWFPSEVIGAYHIVRMAFG